jgi:hypothetical protein
MYISYLKHEHLQHIVLGVERETNLIVLIAIKFSAIDMCMKHDKTNVPQLMCAHH